MSMKPTALVIGAGIGGIATAARLARSGYSCHRVGKERQTRRPLRSTRPRRSSLRHRADAVSDAGSLCRDLRRSGRAHGRSSRSAPHRSDVPHPLRRRRGIIADQQSHRDAAAAGSDRAGQLRRPAALPGRRRDELSRVVEALRGPQLPQHLRVLQREESAVVVQTQGAAQALRQHRPLLRRSALEGRVHLPEHVSGRQPVRCAGDVFAAAIHRTVRRRLVPDGRAVSRDREPGRHCRETGRALRVQRACAAHRRRWPPRDGRYLAGWIIDSKRM